MKRLKRSYQRPYYALERLIIIRMKINYIYNQDCLEGLKRLPDNSIYCVVTSPPYYGLRDYGVTGQIGLEETPNDYIARLVEVFNEVLRVIKPEGTLWLNIGDSYNGYKGNANSTNSCSKYAGFRNQPARPANFGLECKELKNKDLIGIPWMLAFALRNNGWYLRQDIIWHKPNPMPESVKDRCTKSHEYIFLLSKSARYYFNKEAIMQPAKNKESRPPGIVRNRLYGYKSKPNIYPEAYRIGGKECSTSMIQPTNRNFKPQTRVNKRDVWTVATKPTKDAHFAIFPESLIVDCIKAGCPEGGLVLDPFMGSGTTAIVARSLGRNYIGFELNPEYIAITEKRIYNTLGIFK